MDVCINVRVLDLRRSFVIEVADQTGVRPGYIQITSSLRLNGLQCH